jgi:hypothetical protein
MKKFYYLLLLNLLLVICGIHQTYAQSNFKPGYLVNLQNDTLKGQIDDRGAVRNAKQVKLLTEQGHKQTYKPEEIIGYGVEGKIYRSYLTETNHISEGVIKKSYFMLLLENGRVDLYYLRDEKTKDRYFIQKEGNDLQELKNSHTVEMIEGKSQRVYKKEYLSILQNTLTDCPTLNNNFIKVNFHETSFRKVIRQFNNCLLDKHEEVAIEKGGKLQVRKEVYVGYSQNTVTAKGKYMYFIPLDGKTSPFVSLALMASSDKISKSLSIGLSADYIPKGAFFEKDREFDFHFLDFRLFPEYMYPKGRIRPIVSAGILYGVRINSSESAMYRFQSDGTKVPYSPEISEAPNREVGYGVETGANFLKSSSSSTGISLRLGYSRGILSYNTNHYYINNTLYAKVGFAF